MDDVVLEMTGGQVFDASLDAVAPFGRLVVYGFASEVPPAPADSLAEAVEEAFPQHPDAEIILSFPGLGIQLGARVLAEIGDDRTRFADARGLKAYAGGLKAYAGASPITRASGKKSSTTRRWVENDRLNHADYLWAFSAITASPGAKAHYRRRRDDHGDWQLPPRGTSSTACSASSTSASSTTRCSMNTPPQLDTLSA